MKNMVVLYQTDDGEIYCKQLTKKGIEYVTEVGYDEDPDGYWEEGGTIFLDELVEILDKDV